MAAASSNFRSPALDPADPAARGERAPSKAGVATETARDAAARSAERNEDDGPKLTAEQAKMLLLDAARAFDPLKQIREHPFAVVGVAAGAGVVLGSSGGSMVALTKLALTASKLLKPLSGILGQYAVTRLAAGQAAGANADAADAADATSV